MSFVTSFTSATTARNAELASPFSAEELDALLSIWANPPVVEGTEDIDPEAAFDAVAAIVGDERCEDACIILEWA